ncbi:glycosyltransferase family 9 protein [Geotalea uraniireducens]|uniref:Glycosyl transferase, family 9 n=1 Tax=Geotalea uraniireducens (strain Rf4) TaxID=351605 RepID=A5G841_GEOUR|nr:glycosyltransferase family 9 protein [Geotalea uraniireducens]ABQ27959.1 glycosyl transferase, family 9 [Geotalea uraniireducens Rf4]
MPKIQEANKILIPRFDTFGDIILLANFIDSLLERLPHAEITMLVRDGYDQLAPVLSPRLRWITTSLFPYANYDPLDRLHVDALLKRLGETSWDLLLNTAYTRTWLDSIINASVHADKSIAIGDNRRLEESHTKVLDVFGLRGKACWDYYVPVSGTSHETDKYKILYETLFDEPPHTQLTGLSLGSESLVEAESVLLENGLSLQEYFVCLPGGGQNVPIKMWPLERFVDVILWACEKFSLKVLLVGQENERELLQNISGMLHDRGGSSSLWTGKAGQLPLLLAILSKASFYLGNDSGPMHMASAVGIPVVGIFGGGYWPRFLPVGNRAIAVAGDLPCFGCTWECPFIDAPCVRLVEVEDVKKALMLAYKGESPKQSVVFAEHKESAEVKELMLKQYANFMDYKNAQLLHSMQDKNLTEGVQSQIGTLCERYQKLFEWIIKIFKWK